MQKRSNTESINRVNACNDLDSVIIACNFLIIKIRQFLESCELDSLVLILKPYNNKLRDTNLQHVTGS